MTYISSGIVVQFASIPIRLHIVHTHWRRFLEKKYSAFLSDETPKHTITVTIRKTPTNFRYQRSLSMDRVYVQNNCRKFKLFNTSLKIIFATYLARHDGIIYHASCVQKHGKGYIFIGPSGSGKSTILKMFSDHQSFGDDSAIVRYEDGNFFLYSSPFYEKNRIPKIRSKVPIKGIYFLYKSPKNSLRPTESAHLKLFQHIWLHKLHSFAKADRVFLQKQLWLFSHEIATQIPVFDLFFTKHPNCLELIEI